MPELLSHLPVERAWPVPEHAESEFRSEDRVRRSGGWSHESQSATGVPQLVKSVRLQLRLDAHGAGRVTSSTLQDAVPVRQTPWRVCSGVAERPRKVPQVNDWHELFARARAGVVPDQDVWAASSKRARPSAVLAHITDPVRVSIVDENAWCALRRLPLVCLATCLMVDASVPCAEGPHRVDQHVRGSCRGRSKRGARAPGAPMRVCRDDGFIKQSPRLWHDPSN